MSSKTIYTCEVCKREFGSKERMKINGVMLYGYHTCANRIECESPSRADRHVCYDCARNIAIAFFCPQPDKFKRGDAVCPRRYGEL